MKNLPTNLEAEKAVLGGILIDSEVFYDIADAITPDHFYSDKNKRVFKAILDLFKKNDPIDLVTLVDRLKKNKDLVKSGGRDYITSLIEDLPIAENVRTYSSMVKEAYIKRELVRASKKIGELSMDPSIETGDLLDRTEQMLFRVSKDTVKQDYRSAKEVIESVWQRLEELQKYKGKLRGVPTGFPTLDKITNGLQSDQLVIVAARPSVGKSSFAFNIAQFASSQKKTPVGIFSLEMSGEDILDRMISVCADVDLYKIKTGNMSDEENKRMGEAYGILADTGIFIDDTPGVGVLEVRTKARRMKMEHDIQMIIIDYIQLMKGRGIENRAQEVAEISQSLKALARELKIPVVALSQLNRAVESRADGPKLSDLRESGAKKDKEFSD